MTLSRVVGISHLSPTYFDPDAVQKDLVDALAIRAQQEVGELIRQVPHPLWGKTEVEYGDIAMETDLEPESNLRHLHLEQIVRVWVSTTQAELDQLEFIESVYGHDPLFEADYWKVEPPT